MKRKVVTCIKRQKITSVAFFRTLTADHPWSFRDAEPSNDQGYWMRLILDARTTQSFCSMRRNHQLSCVRVLFK